jgi:hypothetical protein
MNPVYVPSTGIEDWRRLLAQPDKQWREGYSAMCIAKAWQNATGFPAPIAAVLEAAGDPLASLEPLLILPEHKVPLPGGRRESQNDVWVLARHGGGLASITIEGKVSESLGTTLDEWRKGESDGKRERLAFLTNTLGVANALPSTLRYQLLHRTASAVIEAERFRANIALMMIESFSTEEVGLTDFQAFTQLFGVHAEPDRIVRLSQLKGITLYVGWVRHPMDTLGISATTSR